MSQKIENVFQIIFKITTKDKKTSQFYNNNNNNKF